MSELSDLDDTMMLPEEEFHRKILRKNKRYRLKKRTPALIAQLAERAARGESRTIIAQALGVTVATVLAWSRRHGIVIKRDDMWADPVRRAKMIANLRRGGHEGDGHHSREAWADPEFRSDVKRAWQSYNERRGRRPNE